MTDRSDWEDLALEIHEGWTITAFEPEGFKTEGMITDDGSYDGGTIRLQVNWNTHGASNDAEFVVSASTETLRRLSGSILIGSSDRFWKLEPSATSKSKPSEQETLFT